MNKSPTSPLPALAPTATYAEAYATLAAIAERLRSTGTTATIDTLASDLREARAAHAVCRDRLAAIRREIDAEITAVRADETTAVA
ncbi:hypothetical protein [Lichenifustis flavocetrariae]|uniref:Uncharacterized protein n=1 Tax=Lichenifustis flavocetrariae TaxID=2949735 RepID=A0AA41Z4V3_9HYPH|nr:hypothetical protein [Lichenifustis flavocetrariae]MCW6512988.1 hypothetical protein [Lichenifustis flavocetrariae]